VVERRDDGYHDLVTLFRALPWGDRIEVTVEDEPGVRLEVEGDASVPRDESNLAHRAARAYLDRAAERDVRAGARIRLAKEVPPGAGLGGGSSDAAAVLRALQERLAALGPSETEDLARDLGADVPFFLHGGTAIGRGRGDAIEPLDEALPGFDVVLVMPPFGTETARVFEAYDRWQGGQRGSLEEAVAAVRSGVPERIRAAHRNDLARPALAAYPALRAFTRDVERLLGRPPCLSGSGSTLYDVPDPGGTDDVVARLAALPGRRLVLRA
jgi:4-diphosphocytidyl-2-C-methyl-D-erythritol kinase